MPRFLILIDYKNVNTLNSETERELKYLFSVFHISWISVDFC